jgi:hypothetical protein
MTLRIYLSSTFLDLEEERALVAEYIKKAQHLPIETVTARANPVLDECLADVESCQVLILLVASSYGTIVANREGIRRSVTHHEFLHARARGIPVLAFELAYVKPPDPQTITDEQRQGLETLKRELTNMERIVAPATSQSRMMGEVLVAVNLLVERSERWIRTNQAAAFVGAADGERFALPPPGAPGLPPAAHPPVASLPKEMYLQVQLKPLADYFVLIPEVFLPGPGPGEWQPRPDVDPEPREGVPLAALVDSLAELCEQAQRALPPGPAQWIEKAVIELLLPDELLAELLVAGRAEERLAVAEAGDLRGVLADLAHPNFDYPCILRSLERAERCKRAPIQANTIRDHWLHSQTPTAGLLACSRWPEMNEASILSFQIDLRDSQRAVSDQDPEGKASALVALLPCPADLEGDGAPRKAGALLQAILRSPLPVVLFWRDDGGDPASRWSHAGDLLDRQLPAVIPSALRTEAADSHQLHFVRLPPRAWCSLAAAERGRTLLAKRQQWVHQAVLLVDSPQRWPGRITPVRPKSSGRLQLRRATTP